MANEAVLSESLDSRVLAVIWQYAVVIILAMTFLQLSRLAISTVLRVLQALGRIVVLVISWPVYLILLPARALVFLTRLAVKVAFYVAIAAFLYRLFGALKSESIRENFGAILQYVQATFSQQ